MAADSQQQTATLLSRGPYSSRRPRANYGEIVAFRAGENEHPNSDSPPAGGAGQCTWRAAEACNAEQYSQAPFAPDPELAGMPSVQQQQQWHQQQQHLIDAAVPRAKRQRGAAAAAVAAIVQAAEAESDFEDDHSLEADSLDEDEAAQGGRAAAGRAAAADKLAQRQRKRRTRVLVDVHGGAGPGAAAAAAAGGPRELRPEDVENEYERQVGWPGRS